jgi:hypothetical protein
VNTPTGFWGCLCVTEESAALFQAATDEHWGVDNSKLMQAVSIHNFDRHFQITRATAYFSTSFPGWWVAEKTGNIQDCIEIEDRRGRIMESYMQASFSPFLEVSHFCSLHLVLSSVWRRTTSTCSHDETFRGSLSMRALKMCSRLRKAIAPLPNFHISA